MVVSAPPIFFPSIFGIGLSIAALLLPIGGIVWRLYRFGAVYQRTPLDWALLLFVLTVPMAVWAAPPPLRHLYAIPRALIIFWNLALFGFVVFHGRRSTSARDLLRAGFILAGVAIAVAALLGTQWASKMPLVGEMLQSLPRPLIGLFAGAVDGFNPNQVGGSLLFVLPPALAIAVGHLRNRAVVSAVFLSVLAAVLVTFVFVAAQSRTAFLALGAGVTVSLLLRREWRRFRLTLLPMAGIVLAVFLLYLTRPGVEMLFTSPDGVTASLAGRVELWERGLHGIADFPITGMGLGTFRELVHVFYPTLILDPDLNLGHAHNFFLQSGLDFGVFGLIAVLAVFCLAWVQLLSAEDAAGGIQRLWIGGLMAAFLAQLFFGLPDTVAMGSKTNFLLWYLLALIQIEGPICASGSGAGT